MKMTKDAENREVNPFIFFFKGDCGTRLNDIVYVFIGLFFFSRVNRDLHDGMTNEA